MFTALEWTTGAKVIVKPIAIRRPNDAYEMLLIADKTTGRGVWFDTNDCEWYIDLQGVDGNLMQEAEVVEDVYGENEEEWEKRANELLAVLVSQSPPHGEIRIPPIYRFERVIPVFVPLHNVRSDDVDSHDCSCLGLSNICLASVLAVGSFAGAAESFIATFRVFP